jgi:AraC-like DNA-binding protein
MTMTSTISEFVWPRPRLADCIAGMVVRDTGGCALDDTQRFNFYPARPWPVVSWRFAGDAHVIDQPVRMERPWTGASLHSFYVVGARLRPSVCWNPGEVYSVNVGFYPYALSAMTGLDLSSFTGRIVPAEEVLPQPMLEACRSFFDGVRHEGLERGFSVFQDKIEIMWAGMRPAETWSRVSLPAGFTADWSRSLMHRARATGSGRSTRQIARRVKSWTGVGERDLHVFGHIEQLSLKWLEAAEKGNVDWAALAAESGFADQAHMIKRLQKYTGFTPKQLHESVRCDEAFWSYRLVARAYLARAKGQQVDSLPHFPRT